MGGYSIYGSSLDRSDMGVRLEAVMADEKGGPDGWKIENCVLLGFELIRTVEREIHQPMFFNTQKEAEDAMFLQFMRMAELLDNPSEINAPMSNEEQKRLVKLRQEIRESDEFETENGGCSETMAWVNDASGGTIGIGKFSNIRLNCQKCFNYSMSLLSCGGEALNPNLRRNTYGS